MPYRSHIIATNEVYTVTNLETGKWFRVLSPEYMQENMSKWPSDKYRIGIMHSNTGLGAPRDDGRPKADKSRIPLSSENPWSYVKQPKGAK